VFVLAIINFQHAGKSISKAIWHTERWMTYNQSALSPDNNLFVGFGWAIA
jgi:hypothetical protein